MAQNPRGCPPECGGRCCEYFGMELDKPTTLEEWEYGLWYLYRNGQTVIGFTPETDGGRPEEGAWTLYVRIPCQYLERGRCSIHRQRRTHICREYGSDGWCEYHSPPEEVYVSTPDEYRDLTREMVKKLKKKEEAKVKRRLKRKLAKASAFAAQATGLLLLALTLTGCVPFAAKTMTAQNAILSRRMAELVEEEKTTREEEQAFIKINAELWTSFDCLLNGKERPKEEEGEDEEGGNTNGTSEPETPVPGGEAEDSG